MTSHLPQRGSNP